MYMRNMYTNTNHCAAGILLVTLLQPSAISAQGDQEQVDTSTQLIEIRFARQAPAPEFQQLTVPRSGRVVHVSDENVFHDGDFEHVRARMTPDSDAVILRARWKPRSGQRMAQIRRGEAGAGNDLLAVFVDGQLVSAPLIVVDPLATAAPWIDISVQVPADEAERIAAAVAARWPGGGR